jgi:tetratricopeptide (TPR) repeat protein
MAYGRFADAAQSFERAARRAAKIHDEDGQLRALQALAEARQALGAPDQAVLALKQAIALAESRGDPRWNALLQAQLGNTSQSAWRRPLLMTALKQTQKTGVTQRLNDLVRARHRKTAAARDAFDEAPCGDQ